jgi:3-oxoisoapionate decarboxylase
MKAGLSSYTYTWAVGVPGSVPVKPLTIYDLIDKAAENEIDLIQVADNLPLENLACSEIELICRYASDKGISLEMGGRGLMAEHTIKCLNTAEKMGSPILRMVIDSPGFEPSVNEIISIIRDLSLEFRSRRIKLAIENHDRLKAREFREIIEAVGIETAGICLDTVNSIGAGEGFEQVCSLLLPCTINLHVKDYQISRLIHKMGFNVEGRPAGKGMLDIRWLIDNLSIYGICRSAILELWTPPLPHIEETIAKENDWAAESLKYLKSLLPS